MLSGRLKSSAVAFRGRQGSALLTNTFRDPTILARKMRYLESWIKDVSASVQ